MNTDVRLELESYCEYLQKSLQNPLVYANEYTHRRHLGEYNNLRYMNGLPMVYEITQEGVSDTLRTVGKAAVVAGKGLFKVAEVLIRGIEYLRVKVVEATANADNVNMKAQVVLANAKHNGVRGEGVVRIAASSIQYNNRVDFDSIITGLTSTHEHLPVFIKWYADYYQHSIDGTSNHTSEFKSFKVLGDMSVSMEDSTEGNHALTFSKAGGRLKAANSAPVLTYHQIEQIVNLVHEIASILRSTHLDKTLDKIKDYIKRVKDQKDEMDSIHSAMRRVEANVLISIVDHLLESCIAVLKYCEQSTH